MIELKALRLTNFKSIGAETQEIEFAPITLLFGPNSAGKSTVLQALVYARDIILHGNLDPDSTDLGGDWLDLGGFKNIIHGRSRNPEASIGLGFRLAVTDSDMPDFLTEHESELLEQAGFYQSEDLFLDLKTIDVDLQIKWSKTLNRPYVETYSCKMDDQEVARIRASSDCKQIIIEEMPLMFREFQLPLDFLDDERSLADVIAEYFDTAVVESASRALFKTSDKTGRPFVSFKIDELETMVEENRNDLRQEVIEELLDELRHRTSRRATQLEDKLKSMRGAEDVEAWTESLSINLKNQEGALPSFQQGLFIDSAAWTSLDNDSDFDSDYDRAMRLFIKRALDKAICGPLACVAELLNKMTYIGPLRDLPPRKISVPKTRSTSRWAKGLAAWEILPAIKDETLDEINFWLGEKCLQSGYQITKDEFWKVYADDFYKYFDQLTGYEKDEIEIFLQGFSTETEIALKDLNNELSVMPQDIGVGISQLFPVVVASVYFKEALISIEQPELHVHPRLQTELADLFIRNSINSGNQFLLETHSEHLMLRLLRRVRDTMQPADSAVDLIRDDSIKEPELNMKYLAIPEAFMKTDNMKNDPAKKNHVKPTDLAVHYVEASEKGTKFTKLRVSDDGDFLDEWPDGFFEERDDELF